MCNNCKATAANTILVLASALEKAYTSNSSHFKALDKLLATHVEAEQMLIDAELQLAKDLKAELESLRGQTVPPEGFKPESAEAASAHPDIPEELKEIIRRMGGNPDEVIVHVFPKG